MLAAALASRAVQLGHVCVELRHSADITGQALSLEGPPLDWPAPDRLLRALEQSPLCSDGSSSTPLVLDARGRLYLHRYAVYERELAAALRARARLLDVDVELLARGIRRLFPEPTPRETTPERELRTERPSGAATQRLAAMVAALHGLAVICGGPGTGKTTTVVKILALLQEQALAQSGNALRVMLLAPTGKAARRLATAVAQGLAELDVAPAVRDSIPPFASTLHRALGFSRSGSQRFRHDASNPLVADVVLIDEVSMVDLGLLYRVVTAIRPEARLILQGDKDQLASVEAGAILGDIYNPRAAASWSEPFREQVRAVTGDVLTASPQASALGDCLVHLTQSYRYGERSGIGRLARAINAGDAAAALRVLRATVSLADADCRWYEQRRNDKPGDAEVDPLEALAIAGYEPFIQSTDPAEKLARLGAYRILCAHRQGIGGVSHTNHAVEGWLERAGLLRLDGVFYENRPIIITHNDYAVGLFNGDVGVVVKDAAGRLRACFETTEGLRFVVPSRLPPHETVFATTIHKSQGSEFDAVSVMLPDAPSLLLGRELLYTAVTRARRRVDLFARSEVLLSALGRAVRRASGLGDALWNPPPSARSNSTDDV